jgi:hypothetical protein
MERQKAANWCWAAVAVSVARYFDTRSDWRQCGVAKLVLSRAHREGEIESPIPVCCTKPIPRGCNQPWYLEDALKQVGTLRGQPKAGRLSFKKIQGKIDADRPVCVRIEWGGGGGHFVVISGYHISRNDVPQVDVEDPLTGAALVNYSDFVRRYRGTGKWTHTYSV